MTDKDLFGKSTEDVLKEFHSGNANRVFIENHPSYDPVSGESFLTHMDTKTKKLIDEHPELVKAMI